MSKKNQGIKANLEDSSISVIKITYSKTKTQNPKTDNEINHRCIS